MLVRPAKFQWALYGALIGLIVTLSDLLIGWRDVTFAPWQGDGIAYNVSKFGGSMLGGAIAGLIAGSIRDAIARRTGKMP